MRDVRNAALLCRALRVGSAAPGLRAAQCVRLLGHPWMRDPGRGEKERERHKMKVIHMFAPFTTSAVLHASRTAGKSQQKEPGETFLTLRGW